MSRAPRYKPACETAFRFLRANKERGYLAPITGQDRRALEAFWHAVELWGTGDFSAEAAGLRACAALLDGMQESVWPIAKAGIPGVLDWSHEPKLWAAIMRHRMKESSRAAD